MGSSKTFWIHLVARIVYYKGLLKVGQQPDVPFDLFFHHLCALTPAFASLFSSNKARRGTVASFWTSKPKEVSLETLFEGSARSFTTST